MVQSVLTLAYFSMAYITRMTRTFMLNVFRSVVSACVGGEL
ncbi:MAG: hypothetical protein ACSLEN_05340 [Candidatus Malihini olakiniferum]